MTTDSISFPNMHITIPYVPKSITIGNFSIAMYGIIIACGMIIAAIFVLSEAKRIGRKQEDFLDLTIWGIVGGVIGARIYYVIFSWDSYKDNLLAIFDIRSGGLAIYGAVIGGVLAGFIVCRVRKMNFFEAADLAAFGLLIGQIMGRWGNFCNREAFGGYTNGFTAMLIPLDAVNRPIDITQEMMDNLVTVDSLQCISVHPTFLYESLWNLGVLIFLLIYRYRRKFNGEIFFLYLGLYGAGRAWIEGLRTDPLVIGDTGLRVSQLLALMLVFVSAIYLCYHYAKIMRGTLQPLPIIPRKTRAEKAADRAREKAEEAEKKAKKAEAKAKGAGAEIIKDAETAKTEKSDKTDTEISSELHKDDD